MSETTDLFKQLEEALSISSLTEEELAEYERSLEDYRRDMAYNEGFEEGREEGIIEVARKLKSMGMDALNIAVATGLSQAQIEDL